MSHHDHAHMGHEGHSVDHSSHTTGMDHSGMNHGHMNHADMGRSGQGDARAHMMAMWFHFGYTEVVLFEQWRISTVGALIGSMIGIFFMAALYEGLKYFREYLFWKTYNALQYRAVTLPTDKGISDENQIVQPTMMSAMHWFQTLLHIVQMIVSYFLMLIFMTYNVWLCMAVVFGAAVGYFLFGWKKSVIVDVTEHCH